MARNGFWKSLWERTGIVRSVKAKVRLGGLQYVDPDSGVTRVAPWSRIGWHGQANCYVELEAFGRHRAERRRPLSFDIGLLRPSRVAHRANGRWHVRELMACRYSMVSFATPAARRRWREGVACIVVLLLVVLALLVRMAIGSGASPGVGRWGWALFALLGLCGLAPYVWLIAEIRPFAWSVGVNAREVVLSKGGGVYERVPWSAVRSVRRSRGGYGWSLEMFNGNRLRLPSTSLGGIRIIQECLFPQDARRDRLGQRASARRIAVGAVVLGGGAVAGLVALVNRINAGLVPTQPATPIGAVQFMTMLGVLLAIAVAAWGLGEWQWRRFVRSRAGRRSGL